MSVRSRVPDVVNREFIGDGIWVRDKRLVCVVPVCLYGLPLLVETTGVESALEKTQSHAKLVCEKRKGCKALQPHMPSSKMPLPQG